MYRNLYVSESLNLQHMVMHKLKNVSISTGANLGCVSSTPQPNPVEFVDL